jgi:hypothetical protein
MGKFYIFWSAKLSAKFIKLFVCPLRDITTEETGVVVAQQDESDLYTGRYTDCPDWDFSWIFLSPFVRTLG